MLLAAFVIGAGLSAWDIWRHLPEKKAVVASPPAVASKVIARSARSEPEPSSGAVNAKAQPEAPDTTPPATLNELARAADADTRAEAEIVQQLIASEDAM